MVMKRQRKLCYGFLKVISIFCVFLLHYTSRLGRFSIAFDAHDSMFVDIFLENSKLG